MMTSFWLKSLHNRIVGRAARRNASKRTPQRQLAVELLEDRTVPAAVAPPSGLVSWWTADNTAADLTGLNNATIYNGTTYAAGEVGQAFSFDGIDDRAQVVDSESLKLTTSLSIEGWILPRDITPNNGGVILFRGDDRGGLDPYNLSFDSSGQLQFAISNSSNTTAVIKTPIPLGQFLHVAATLDDATGSMKLYLNGAEVAHAVTTIRPFRDLDPASNPSIGIGNHGGYPNTPHNFPFNGQIDELSVYNRALTAEEIQAIFNAGSDGKIPMFVSSATPAQGAVVPTAPTNFAISFSYPYNAVTLQANQFQVNGIAATSFEMTDSDTITFRFATSPVTTEGVQTMHLDAGAVMRSGDGLGAAEFTATFRYDIVSLQVEGTDPAIGHSLAIDTFTTAATAVASMAGMNGGNGAWPVLYGAGAVGGGQLRLAVDEDNWLDAERSHVSEQVAFLALDGTASGNVAPYVRTGSVAGVSNSGWMTVNVGRDYASMVVVVTPSYTSASVPLMARVRNASGMSFEVMVERVDGQTGTVGGITVDYTVVEEGTYTVAEHGVKMEAVKFTSTVTDNAGSWVGESRNYANSYASPVVLGQVMSANDPGASVFWARGSGQSIAPSSSALYVGKHIGEDPDTTRDPETIGYIVIESGRGTIGSTGYLAGVGPGAVSGMDDGPPFVYDLTTATLQVHFNESIDPASLGTTDLSLNQGVVSGAWSVDANSAQYSLLGIASDVVVDMAAGAVADQFGNPSRPFSAAYYSGTKFYVVNDGSPDRTYEYGPISNSIENYALASGNTSPRGAASTAAGDKVWVVDANKAVYVYDAGGELLGSWVAGSMNGRAAPEGIATNGTDIWMVDGGGDKVFRYANAASRLAGSQNAASSFSLNKSNKSAMGITTDGTYLWVVDDSSTDKVFKYTLSGLLVGSWTITGGGGSPTGITLDPAAPAHLWIVDNATDRVYQYDDAIGRTSGSQSASTSFALAAENTNPQGIADPPVPGTGTDAGSNSGWVIEPASAGDYGFLAPVTREEWLSLNEPAMLSGVYVDRLFVMLAPGTGEGSSDPLEGLRTSRLRR